MEATIKLFRALPVENKKTDISHANYRAWMEKTIRHGFIFAPDVVANYSNCDELIKLITNTVGLTAEQMNSSFHKSWGKVSDASMEQLVTEQIIHYFTTYGFEALGIDNDFVYIPNEVLEIPNLDNLKLTVIKGYTKDELKGKLLLLLGSGIALADDTIQAVVEVAMFVGIKDFDDVKNKEVRVILYDYSGLIPENPTEFLRYAIFKATSTTLLIKNEKLIKTINDSNNLNIVKIFEDYEKQFGLAKLAEIFYRFKPLFLAFRTNAKMRKLINRVRKLAKTNHKPMPEDYLNTVTEKIDKVLGGSIDKGRLRSELSKVNTFRKIRLAYALNFRTKDAGSILYKIRNGKTYATSFNFDNKGEAERVFNIVLASIADDVSKNVNGKKVYLPDTINYSLPATEKQFIGTIPFGSYVSLPSTMIMGVHWDNVNHNRIDLDLSLMSPETGKIGWDNTFRTDNKTILFSGDMTDADDGASELFFIKTQDNKHLIVSLNYFNFNNDVPVPFKILVANGDNQNPEKNYTVNPNSVVTITNSVINKKQVVLGIIATSRAENRFYFTETSIGNSITLRDDDYAKHSRQYLIDYYEDTVELRNVLEMAGAEFVSQREEADIDLSLEILEKDTILNLLKNVKG